MHLRFIFYFLDNTIDTNTNNQKKMKIVFMGTPEFASTILESLARDSNIEILAVVTQPDKKVGRKAIMTPPAVKVIAQELEIEVIQPKDKEEIIEELDGIDADFFVVVAYGMILPEEVLEMPKHGAINVHASLLPKYRGASPIQESLLHGDKQTGVSIMQMDEKLDHGDIHLVRRIEIERDDDLQTLTNKLASLSAEIIPTALNDILGNELPALAQDHSKATYCSKIKKEDGKIDWSKNAEEIFNMIRAYNPWPAAHTEFNGKKLKILEAESSEENIETGKFILQDGILKIGAKNGAIIPSRVQLEGKKEMDVKDFINGNKQAIESQ